jgi:histidinol phosphatase-like enzyme
MSEPSRRGTIVVDLDGTICEHRFPAFGQPIAGAREALQRLKQAGYWIIIHSVRTSSYYRTSGTYREEVNSPEAVQAFLNQHDIPFDEIWMHDKALAMAYIDDRGLRMVGDRQKSNWQDIADALLPGSRKRRFWRR